MNYRISPSNPRLCGDGALPWQRTVGEYSAMQLLNSGRQEVDDRAGFCCCLHRLGAILRSVSCRQDDGVFAPQDRILFGRNQCQASAALCTRQRFSESACFVCHNLHRLPSQIPETFLLSLFCSDCSDRDRQMPHVALEWALTCHFADSRLVVACWLGTEIFRTRL